MLNVLRSLFSPLLGLIVLILGNGLFMTLSTVRLHADGYTSLTIGLVSSAYYVGLVIGSFRIEPFIARVGHIRAYAAFASVLAAMVLLQGMYVNGPLWIALRFVTGYCFAGLYVVIESWLLSKSTATTRGQILAIYMTAFYGAQAGGQFLLNLSNPATLIPFCIVTILTVLSVVPLSVTRVSSPLIEGPSGLNFKELYALSPSGVIGCFAAGLVLGAIYGLLPLFVSNIGDTVSYVATVMGVVIFGGMVLQYPVGHFSDNFDRRTMLAMVSFATVVIAIAIILVPFSWQWTFLSLVFIFGGLTFTLYPLSISHACDYLESKDIVAATQGLLLAYGVGAAAGPLVAPAFMRTLGHNGLFIFFIVVAGGLGLFFMWRKTQREAPTVEEQQDYVPMLRATPIAAELDPRSEENEGTDDA